MMRRWCVANMVLASLVGWALLTSVCLAQAPTEFPSQVIECNPKPFATNVDPNVQQITITFDRPMNKASGSGFGGLRFAGVYPAANNAQPTWDATGTICSLPVTLEPDVTMATSGGRGGHIRSRRPRRMPALVGVPGRAGRPVGARRWDAGTIAHALGEAHPRSTSGP